VEHLTQPVGQNLTLRTREATVFTEDLSEKDRRTNVRLCDETQNMWRNFSGEIKKRGGHVMALGKNRAVSAQTKKVGLGRSNTLIIAVIESSGKKGNKGGGRVCITGKKTLPSKFIPQDHKLRKNLSHCRQELGFMNWKIGHLGDGFF